MHVTNISILLSLTLFTACSSAVVPTQLITSEQTINAAKPALDPAQKKTWDLMIGKWYGSQPTKNGGVKKEIMERAPDGSYMVTFRNYDKLGNFKDTVEAGHWGVSSPIYFVIFRGWIKGEGFQPADPQDSYNYDAYEIINLTDSVFEYKSYNSGNTYTLHKVAADFSFPEKIGAP